MFVVLLTGASASAQLDDGEPGKRMPWTWSEEQRVSERLNPQAQEKRRQRAIAQGMELPEGVTVISGSSEPELFLPEELFDIFLSEVLAEDPRIRSYWRTEISSHYSGGLPSSFWKEFDEVAHALNEVLKKLRRLRQTQATADGADRDWILARTDQLAARRCYLFKRALARSRGLLPSGEFDRLLYEGVAPNLVTHESTSSPDLMALLEKGC